jgi:hypothetical protein
MARAVVAGIVGFAFVLTGCSGGNGSPFGSSPACPLLAQLAQTGETVASADVSDPTAFDATMRNAIKTYVRAAKKLRDAVPDELRDDVDRMIAAAEQRRFADATAARANVDSYARSHCNTSAATK